MAAKKNTGKSKSGKSTQAPPSATNKKKGGGGMLLMAALGAALAAGAGYYATHKEEVDREAKKRIDELAKAFKESQPQVEKKVREVWGIVSEEAVAIYMDVRAGLLHALEEENVKKTGKMLKREYIELVEKAVRKAKRAGLLDKDIEKKLAQLLKMDWKDVQKIMESGAVMAADAAKKGVNKASKEVAKRRRAAARAKKSGAKKTSAKRKTAKKTSAKRKPAAKKKPARKATAKKSSRNRTKKK